MLWVVEVVVEDYLLYCGSFNDISRKCALTETCRNGSLVVAFLEFFCTFSSYATGMLALAAGTYGQHIFKPQNMVYKDVRAEKRLHKA